MEHLQPQDMEFDGVLVDEEADRLSQDGATLLHEDNPFATQHLDDTILGNENQTLKKLVLSRKAEPNSFYNNWSSQPSSHQVLHPSSRLFLRSSFNPFSHQSLHFPENDGRYPSRCPSLMSTGTLSSRDSSTRSTIWLESMGRQLNRRSKEETDGTSALAQSDQRPTQSTQFTAQIVELCPWKDCDRYLRGFTKAGDRERHLLLHCDTPLVCDFCALSGDHDAVFAGPDRVTEFLIHLVRNHEANETEDPPVIPIHPVYKVPIYTGTIRRRSDPIAKCPICKTRFTAGSMCAHLPDCVCTEVTRMADSRVGVHRASDKVGWVTSMDATTLREALVSQYDEGTPSIHDAQNESAEQPEPIYPGCEDIPELTASSSRLSLVSSRANISSEEETDFSEGTVSRESSPVVSKIPNQMIPAKRRLVDAIMEEFQKVFCATLRSHATNGFNPSSCSNTTGNSIGTFTCPDASFNSRKRSLSGDGSTPPDDDDDSNKRRRPNSVSKGKQPVLELRFACPYYKRNPGRHQTFTSCRDPGFTTVARLKEHLYRRHLLPPQCNRCCTTFTNDVALREHQRDPNGCELREQLPLEGFDKEQEKKIKSKKGSQMHQNEVEKWKAVYRILFPDDNDTDMPSPYIEYQLNTASAAEPPSSTRFQEFSRLELPRLVRRTLESIVEHEAQPLEERLKEQLVDIVRQCQTQLETMFQTAAGPSNTKPEAILSSRAMLSEQVAECPIGTHLPTTLGGSASADLQTTSEVIPHKPEIYESSDQGEVVLAMADPISDSSDSGYDSISLAALPATGVPNEFPPEYFDPNQYLDLGDYPHFPDIMAGATVQLTDVDANDDHSMWPLIDKFPGINHANSTQLEGGYNLDHNWQF